MLREASRYVFVQLAAYAIDYGVYAGLYFATERALLANAVSKIAAGAFAFVIHRFYTFDAAAGPVGVQLPRYAALLLLNIPLSGAALYVFMHWLPALVAKVVADVACVVVTYTLSRRLVFIRDVAGPR